MGGCAGGRRRFVAAFGGGRAAIRPALSLSLDRSASHTHATTQTHTHTAHTIKRHVHHQHTPAPHPVCLSLSHAQQPETQPLVKRRAGARHTRPADQRQQQAASEQGWRATTAPSRCSRRTGTCESTTTRPTPRRCRRRSLAADRPLRHTARSPPNPHQTKPNKTASRSSTPSRPSARAPSPSASAATSASSWGSRRSRPPACRTRARSARWRRSTTASCSRLPASRPTRAC